MHRYAQIDDTGRVIGVSELAAPVEGAQLIPLAEEQAALGMVWDGTQFLPAPEPEED